MYTLWKDSTPRCGPSLYSSPMLEPTKIHFSKPIGNFSLPSGVYSGPIGVCPRATDQTATADMDIASSMSAARAKRILRAPVGKVVESFLFDIGQLQLSVLARIVPYRSASGKASILNSRTRFWRTLTNRAGGLRTS